MYARPARNLQSGGRCSAVVRGTEPSKNPVDTVGRFSSGEKSWLARIVDIGSQTLSAMMQQKKKKKNPQNQREWLILHNRVALHFCEIWERPH